MSQWATSFFILAVVAGIFGFGGFAGSATGIAQTAFVLFLVVSMIIVVGEWMTHRRSFPS